MNPFDALAEFVLGKIKEGLYAAWPKFLFEIAFSAVVSFLFGCGSLLFARAPVEIAIGFGMIWAAMAMTLFVSAGNFAADQGHDCGLAGRRSHKRTELRFSNHSENRPGEKVMSFKSILQKVGEDFKRGC